MQSIDVMFERILYSEVNKYSESGLNFVIARASRIDNGEHITVKGDMLEAVKYENYRLFGATEEDKKYNEPVFKFKSFHIIAPIDKKGAYKYLIRYCKGIGPVASDEIIEHFGASVIDTLMEDPDKILEVTSLSESQRLTIHEHFKFSNMHVGRVIAELSSLLEGFRVSHKTIEKIAGAFQSSTLEIITKNPYILINFPRMGWETVDSIARQRFNVDAESPVRIVAAIAEVARRQSDDGHTCYKKEHLGKGIFELVGSKVKDEWLEWSIRDGVLHQDGDIYQLVESRRAELLIAANIARLTRDALPLEVFIGNEGLEGDQLVIPDLLLENGVAIVSGIPGSGKTYAISYVCNNIERVLSDMVFKFAAPTGRAAKKLKELLDHHNPSNSFACSTIHRLLRWVFSEKEAGVPESVSKPKRGRERFEFPDDDYAEEKDDDLPVGLYTLEETSMVDIFMGSSLLSKIPSGSRVCFVGDPYQLQSIRAGAFLRDMLDAGVPSVRLETPRRNAGRIARACCDIKNGACPTPSPKFDLETGENWLHFEASEPEDIQNVIVRIYEKTKLDKFKDIQMISPQKETAFIGCEDMNKVLSKLLNPRQQDVMKGVRSGLPFTVGDKIIRTKNGTVNGLVLDADDGYDEEWDWETGESQSKSCTWNGERYQIIPTAVVNGDIGEILGSLCHDNKWNVVVSFMNPIRICMLPMSDHKLSLAYAITTHKCQGSGARCIITPISNVFYSGLYTRELVYTTLSRAEERLYTVGSMDALGEAVKRKTLDKRRTRLKDFVKKSMMKENCHDI